MASSPTPYALVVDDDTLILMDAADMLEDAGFLVHEAGNGDSAMRVLNDHAERITLLFTDVEMPGTMNGFALAREVDRQWPHIEIVIASGRVAPGLDDMPAKATFIPKPFSAAVLLDHLRAKLPDEKKPGPLRR